MKSFWAEESALRLRIPMIRLLDGSSGGGSVKSYLEMGRTYVPPLTGFKTMVEMLGTSTSLSVFHAVTHLVSLCRTNSCLCGSPWARRGTRCDQGDSHTFQRHGQACPTLLCRSPSRQSTSSLPLSLSSSPPDPTSSTRHSRTSLKTN